MKKLILSALLSAFAALATPVTNVTLVSVPSNAPRIGSPSVIVSPYTLSVYGQNVAALCIDFKDHSSVGQSWSAYLNQDGIDISNTYHPGSLQQYEEVAYIYTEITKPGLSAQNKTDLQEAAWDIMDPTYFGSNWSYAPDSNALCYITDAQNNYKSVDFSKFMIVSSVSSTHAQEFLIPLTTPEPASYALFGTGLVVAGFVALRRSQAQRL